MNPPADDTPVLEVLIYRLHVMEQLLAKAEEERTREREKADAGWRAFSERVDSRFNDITARFNEMTATMGRLAYVPAGQHAVEHRALEDRLTSAIAVVADTAAGEAKAAKKAAEGADRHAWWGIALICATVIGAILTASISQAF